jgi:hypothetical protein
MSSDAARENMRPWRIGVAAQCIAPAWGAIIADVEI